MDYDPKLDDGQQLVTYEGLTVYEGQGQPQPEQPRQEQPRPERGGAIPSGELAGYLADLESFAKNCTNLDDFYQYARIFNVRMQDVPGAEHLLGMMEAFAKEVGTMANDVNLATVSANNQNYTKQTADNSAEIGKAREKFQPMMQEIRQVMAANQNHPGIRKTMATTRNYVERYLTSPVNQRARSSTNGDFVFAAPGAGQQDRQKAMNAIYEYMTAVNDQTMNKYVKSVPDAKTEEEFYRRSYARISANIAKGLKPEIAKDVPVYDVAKYGPYGKRDAMQNYCRDLDAFLKTAIEKGAPDVAKNTAGRMVAGAEMVRRANNLNSMVKGVGELLESPDYTRDAKLSLMGLIKNTCDKRGWNVPSVNGNTDINQWMEALGREAQASAKDKLDAKNMLIALNDAIKTGPEHMENLAKAMTFREHYLELQNTMNRSYSAEFDGFMNAMGQLGDRVAAGEEMTRGKLDKVGDWAQEYCMRKVHQNKSSYDSMEATRLGRAIEVLKAVDPERGQLMEDVFGMKVTGEGPNKSYAFRKIPESILQGTSSSKMTLTKLESNIAAYRQAVSTQTGPDVSILTGMSATIIKDVKRADPTLMRSSQQYRDFRKASQTLADEMARADQELQKGGTLSPEKRKELLEKTQAMRTTAKAYLGYKKDGSGLTENGMRRVGVAEQSLKQAEVMEDMLRAPDIKAAFEADPKAAVKAEVDYLLQHRDASQENLAKLMFLKGAEKAIGEGVDPARFQRILTNPERLKTQLAEIQNSEPFKDFCRKNRDIKMDKPMTNLNPDKAFTMYLGNVKIQPKNEPQPEGPKPQPQPEGPRKTESQPQMGGMSAGF